jgi:hypothetical protein
MIQDFVFHGFVLDLGSEVRICGVGGENVRRQASTSGWKKQIWFWKLFHQAMKKA